MYLIPPTTFRLFSIRSCREFDFKYAFVSHYPCLFFSEKYCEDIVGGCVQRLRGSTRQVQVAVMSSLCSIADKSKSLLRDGDHGQVTRLNESFITALDLALS